MRIAICDDNERDIQAIKDALSEMTGIVSKEDTILSCVFVNGVGLAEADREQPFDLIFMDIELEGNTDGFALADRIGGGPLGPRIVFVSQYENFVWTSQKYRPLWFVRKSRLKNDMLDMFRQYYRLSGREEKSFLLKGIRLEARDIVYIECEGHMVTFHTKDGRLIRQYGSLKEIERRISSQNFCRISKNYLVNLRFVKDISAQEVCMSEGEILFMGRDRKKAVEKAFRERGERYV